MFLTANNETVFVSSEDVSTEIVTVGENLTLNCQTTNPKYEISIFHQDINVSIYNLLTIDNVYTSNFY